MKMESESNQNFNNMEIATEIELESTDCRNSDAGKTDGTEVIEPIAVDTGTSKTDTEASKTTNISNSNMEITTEIELVEPMDSRISAPVKTDGSQGIEPIAVTSKTDTEASKATNIEHWLSLLPRKPFGWQKKWIARLIGEGMSPKDAIDFASDEANWPAKPSKPEKPPPDPNSVKGSDSEMPAPESQQQRGSSSKNKKKKLKEKARLKRRLEEARSLQNKTMDDDQNPNILVPQCEESSSESSPETDKTAPESQHERGGCSKNKKKKIKKKARMKRRLEEARSLQEEPMDAQNPNQPVPQCEESSSECSSEQDSRSASTSKPEKYDASQSQPEQGGSSKNRKKKIRERARKKRRLEEARSLLRATDKARDQDDSWLGPSHNSATGQQVRNPSTSNRAPAANHSSSSNLPYSMKPRTSKPYLALVPVKGVKGGMKPKLRNHLSGAQKLKLKYWLSQGLPYEDAVTKAREPIKLQQSISLESSVPGCKPPRPCLVYIVPHGYPTVCLSEEQLAAIEKNLLEAIFHMDEKLGKPGFKDSCCKDGRYMITCKDEFSKKWLSEYLKEYQPGPDVHLEILPDLKKTKARATLPLCTDDDDSKLLTFIGKQNQLLKVGVWDVLHREDTDSNTLMDLDIDVESARMLMECSTISFKLGSADITLFQADAKCQTPRVLLATRNKYGLASHIMNPPDFPHLNDSYEAEFPSPTTRSIWTQTTAPLKAHLSLAGAFREDDMSLPGAYYVGKAVAKKLNRRIRKSRHREKYLNLNSGNDQWQSPGSNSGWVNRRNVGAFDCGSQRSFNSSSVVGSGGLSGWRSYFPSRGSYSDRREPLPRGDFLQRPWGPPLGYQRRNYPPWNDYHPEY